MARALTTKAVEAAKADKSRREIPDPALSGLYLVVQPSGAKSWALRYRYGGKSKKLTLGKWPIMGVANARAAASKAIEAVDHGDDPNAAKKATKAAKMEAQLSERDRIKTLVGQFGKRHLSKLKSGETVKRELDRHVVAVWGDRDIRDITKRDVIDLLDGIAESGRVVTANRTRAYLSGFLNWCVERDIIGQSPAMGVKPSAKERARERVLSDDEIRWFWRACEDLDQPWGPMAKTLLLTGQRLGEVVNMTDREITGDLWHLTNDRTKNGRAHDVPLSSAASDVLWAVERIKGDAGYVFTTTGESGLQGYFKGRNRIARRMAEIASEERGEAVGIPHWTFHDLRRTAATGMARLGIPVRVTEAVLNHVSGTGGGIVSVYQRHDYANEKRDALDAWARFVNDLVEGSAGYVVQIRGGGVAMSDEYEKRLHAQIEADKKKYQGNEEWKWEEAEKRIDAQILSDFENGQAVRKAWEESMKDPEYAAMHKALVSDGVRGLEPFIAKVRVTALASAQLGDMTELSGLVRDGIVLNEAEREFVVASLTVKRDGRKKADLTDRIGKIHFWLSEVDGASSDVWVHEIMKLTKLGRSAIFYHRDLSKTRVITQEEIGGYRLLIRYGNLEVLNYFREIDFQSE